MTVQSDFMISGIITDQSTVKRGVMTIVVKNIRNRLTLMVVMVLCSTQVLAGNDLDKETKMAIEQTKTMMTNKDQRNKELSTNTKAKENDAAMRENFGDEKTEQIYGLSTEVLDQLLQQENGDPKALEKLLQEAQSNPQAFYEKLNPTIKNKIKKLSTEVERKPSQLSSPL
jgi:hypothetical protein